MGSSGSGGGAEEASGLDLPLLRRAIRAAVTHGGETGWLLDAEADLLAEGLAPVIASLVRAERDRADAFRDDLIAARRTLTKVERWLADTRRDRDGVADRVRRECAEELQSRLVTLGQLRDLAASWSTPDPGEPT